MFLTSAGLMKFTPSMQGEVLDPFVGRVFTSTALFSHGTEAKAYMLDMNGLLLRWTRSTGLDTMAVFDVDISRPLDRLLVLLWQLEVKSHIQCLV